MTMLAEELNQVDTSGTGQLAVSEIFGPTFQGEGPSVGRYSFFLRLAGCNQHCSWCDTPYTWDWTGRNGRRYDPKEEVKKYSVDDVIEEIARLEIAARVRLNPMLVITGGEPMLQQQKLIPLLIKLQAKGWRIEVETAATVYPLKEFAHLVNQFNCSPKLENSGNPLRTRFREHVIDAFQNLGNAVWKFVVTNNDDLAEVKHIVTAKSLSPVYIMPEGKTRQEMQMHMSLIARRVLDEGWNLSTRLHVEIWGDRRGV